MDFPPTNRRRILAGAASAGLLLPLSGAVIGAPARPRTGVRRFYRPEDGANLQPAFQRAIDWAGANRADVVSDLGPIRGEMWCPVRSRPDALPGDGTPLVVRHAMAIDFSGASFRLKGPGGTPRMRGQPGKWNGQAWLGGWLYADGTREIARIDIANVVVDGMYDGDVSRNVANVSDKGFFLFHEGIREVRMRNVELRNFAGEIYYIGGPGPAYQQIEDCHFHGSPQAAWNPGGTGRVLAVNLRAGRAYQCAEVIGGKGHVYRGGRFYDAGMGGNTIYGGPSPGFRPRYPYSFAWWDGKGAPPYVRFFGTEFVNARALYLGSWMRGRIRLVDTSLYLSPSVGHLTDLDLDIDAVADRQTNNPVVMMMGLRDLGARVAKAPPDARYLPPDHIRLRIACSRTAAAKAGRRMLQTPFRYQGGHVDLASVRISARGEARNLMELSNPKDHPDRAPKVADMGLVRI